MAERHPPQPFGNVESATGAATRVEATNPLIEHSGAASRVEAHELPASTAGAQGSSAPAREIGPADIHRRDQMIRAGRVAGRTLGNAVQYARNLASQGRSVARGQTGVRRGELVDKLKDLTRQHPSALAGAAFVGFVAGRLLRRL